MRSKESKRVEDTVSRSSIIIEQEQATDCDSICELFANAAENQVHGDQKPCVRPPKLNQNAK